MKIRPVILSICAVVLVVLVLILCFARRPAKIPTEISATPTGTQQTPNQPSQRKAALPIRTNAPAAAQIAPSPANVAARPPSGGNSDRAREVLATYNDVPIIFFGKLEDQFGNAVVGAEITGNTIIYNGQNADRGQAFAVSDGNGLFTLDAGKGESLGVVPRKEGYVLATTGTAFKYSLLYENHVVADPANPIVMKMWKLQGAQHLIHFSITAYVPLDGTAVAFNLQTGKEVTAGGDIVLRVKSPPKPNVVERYDWQAAVVGVNGGVIRSTNSFDQMFEAPESGYEPEFDVSYQKDVKPWSDGLEGALYFKSRDGAFYGKLGIELTTDVVKNGAIPVVLDGYFNPAGSRNLEIDSKLITGAWTP